MRPSLIATACTMERRWSCVAIRPLSRTRSAGPAGSAPMVPHPSISGEILSAALAFRNSRRLRSEGPSFTSILSELSGDRGQHQSTDDRHVLADYRLFERSYL